MKRKDPHSGFPGEPSDFLPTDWSLLRQAASGDAVARDTLYRLYRRPVYHYLRRRAPALVDAEALADRVMESILAPGFLAPVAPARGRFRDLLFAMSRHALMNAKRKEHAAVRRPRGGLVSLQDLEGDPAASDEDRADFDLFYAREVMEAALEALEAKRGREAEALRLRYFEERSQAEIAARLGVTVAVVNNHIARGRERLRKLLEEVVAPVCRAPEEVGAEIDFLIDVLARRGRRAAR